MFVNLSRGDKNEPPSQYRRSGQSAQPNSPRNFSGGGGGSTTTAPPSSASYSGKSFKKVVSNAQGAQGMVTGPNPNVNSGFPNSSTGDIGPQNGVNIQPPTRGTPDASSTGAPVKVADASVQKSTPGLPKAPQNNAVQLGSGAIGPTGPSTLVKGSGDASRAFPLQFGSISLGVMNGMQVPARTDSALPNMDEQRRAQGCLDSLEATTFQNPATVPKQDLPRKDAGQVDKPNVNEACPTSKGWNKGTGPMIQPGWDPRVEMQGNLGRGDHGVKESKYGVAKVRDEEQAKVRDEEQAKQRQWEGILNKLTPQNFEKLLNQVRKLNFDNANTLSGLIGQGFDKALMEPTFVEMYANFCSRLSFELPDIMSENKEKVTFKKLLLNKCQREFERGLREEDEANRTDEDGKRHRRKRSFKAQRRMLGNIRLIGELYKKKMLTERIMHECIKKLLGQHQNPDEEDIEVLCKLMSTIGEMIDHPKAKEHMDGYFDMMLKLSNNMDLSSRLRFMLKDTIDLRKNKWQQKRKVEGPKQIQEVHRDAANECQA